MSLAKFPDAGRGRPISAVRLALFAAECGWTGKLAPVRSTADQDVVRLTLTRGVWPNPGSWEVQLNWAAPLGVDVFERRHMVVGRTGGGPWLEVGVTINDAKALMERHRAAPVSTPFTLRVGGASPGSLRGKARRNR